MLDTARILLVEDEPAAAALVEEELAGSGHTLRWVRSIRDARPMLESWQPTILLLDTSLETDGLEFFQGLRNTDREPDAGTVLLVDDTDTLLKERALQLGPAAVVTKPIDPGALLASVSDMLNFPG